MLVCCREIPGRPGCQPEETCRGTAPEMIVRRRSSRACPAWRTVAGTSPCARAIPAWNIGSSPAAGGILLRLRRPSHARVAGQCPRLSPSPLAAPSAPSTVVRRRPVAPPQHRTGRLSSSAPAMWAQSTGRQRVTASGSAPNQRSICASCLLRRSSGIASSINPAAPTKSSPASAWRIASLRIPFRLYHPLARRCKAASRSSLLCQQVQAQHIGKQLVIAVPLACVVQRHDKEVAPLQRLQPACPLPWPVTASHSPPLSRSRIAVCSRKLRTSAGCRASTSATR